MKLDKNSLEKLAHLSRLYFDEKDEAKMLVNLNTILSWVEKLQEVETENVAPLTHMSEEMNVLRKDIKKQGLPREDGLKCAPKKDKEHLRVPKVIQ